MSFGLPTLLIIRRWCIQLTRLTLVCEVIRYRLVQVRQNLKKKKKKNFSGRRPAIAFLYLFLFHSLLRLTSFLSQYKNEHCWSMDRTICLLCSPMCETRSSVYVMCETPTADSPPLHQRTGKFLSSVPGKQSCWSCIFFEPCSTSLELFTCWRSGKHHLRLLLREGFWTFWKNHAI